MDSTMTNIQLTKIPPVPLPPPITSYVFVGYHTNPGIVDKIDPNTMTLVSTFTAPPGHNDVLSLTQNRIIGNNYAVFK